SCRVAEAGDDQDRGPRYPSLARQPVAFFRGTKARKVGKVRKGVCVMTLSTFPTFPTFLTFGLVRAGWLKFVITMAGLSIGGRSTRVFFPDHLRQKGQKGQKGGACHAAEHLSDLSDLSDTEAAVAGHLEEFPGRPSGAPRKPWVAARAPADESAPR